MNKIKLFLLPFVLLTLVACGTLAPGGAYKDKVLYSADLTIATSYDLVHSFVTWEYNNRPSLKAMPQVTAAADNIRANARQWFGSAIALRDAYAANPTSDTLSKLNAALEILRTAMNEAVKYFVPSSATSIP